MVDQVDLQGFRLCDPSGEQVNIINDPHKHSIHPCLQTSELLQEYCHAPQVDQSVRAVSQGLRVYHSQFVRMCQQKYAVWKAMTSSNAILETFVTTDASVYRGGSCAFAID